MLGVWKGQGDGGGAFRTETEKYRLHPSLEGVCGGILGEREGGSKGGGKGGGGDQKEVETDLHAIANVGEEHRHIFSDRHRRNHLEQIIFSSSCLLDAVSCREEERRLGYPWHPTPWHSCTRSAEQSGRVAPSTRFSGALRWKFPLADTRRQDMNVGEKGGGC